MPTGMNRSTLVQNRYEWSLRHTILIPFTLFIIADLNEGQIVTQFTDERINLQLKHKIKNLIKTKKEGSKPLLVIVGERSLGRDDHDSWIWKSLSEARTKLIQAHIPVYPTVRRAVRAVSKFINYYQRCEP